MNSIGDRLRYLGKEKLGGLTKLADILEMKPPSLQQYLNGRSKPGADVVTKLSKYDVNLHWLLTGEGDPLLHRDLKSKNIIVADRIEPYQVNRSPMVVTVDQSGKDNIVMVPVKAQAGYLRGFGDTDFIQKLPSYRIPGVNNGTFRMFEVRGDSMHPTLKPSDIVVCEWVSDLKLIRDDRIYVIVSRDEGVIVKRLINRILSDEKLICNSDNREGDLYPPIILNPDQIHEIWYVRMYISHQLTSPSDWWSRLIDIESQVTLLKEEVKKQKK